jgi:hypothetical protein
MKGTLSAEHSTFTAIFRCPFEGLSLNATYNTLYAHCLQMASVCWRPTKNERQCIGRTMYLHGSVLAFIRGIMLKLHYYHKGYSAYKRCELGCNGKVVWGTLHGKQSNFTAGSRFPFEAFSWNPNHSLQFYCLEMMSVWLASAMNERKVFYATHIYERGKELCCYSFLYIFLCLPACCFIHFYSCSFSMHVQHV